MPEHVVAVTKRSSPSAEDALYMLLTMLADGLLVKYEQRPAIWSLRDGGRDGRKWVQHGLGEYVGDTLRGLTAETQLLLVAEG